MPVTSTTGNIANLPLLSRDARLRASVAPVQERATPEGRVDAQAAQNAERTVAPGTEAPARDSLLRRLDPTALDLRSAPELDELPTAQRTAILSYLENASFGAPSAAEGAELLVGVDTFV